MFFFFIASEQSTNETLENNLGGTQAKPETAAAIEKLLYQIPEDADGHNGPTLVCTAQWLESASCTVIVRCVRPRDSVQSSHCLAQLLSHVIPCLAVKPFLSLATPCTTTVLRLRTATNSITPRAAGLRMTLETRGLTHSAPHAD